MIVCSFSLIYLFIYLFIFCNHELRFPFFFVNLRTPVLTSTTLNERSGKKLYFKCEMFQKVGAFKFRGACNAVMKLSDEEAKKGVVTHSSGNHAQV